MTVEMECRIRDGFVLVPLEPDKLARLDPEIVYDCVLSDRVSTAQSRLAKRYFATRDEYAAVNGYTNEEAHIELKFLHGVIAAPGDAPVGRDGRVVLYHGVRIWQLSIRDYSHDELSRLVEGATLALAEASV